ncbi:MAG: DUF4287 domain-containing protein [Chloroflexi bacterium]|nr:DUF4287 domain-containing protein [Chloroflexota bacterium]
MDDVKNTSGYERDFIANAKAQTGRTIEEWMAVIKESGRGKHAEIRDWLKGDHGLDHMRATMLAFMHANDGKPAFDEGELVENLFAGKDQARACYDALKLELADAHPNIRFVPKKTYVSLDGEKVLGCATPTKTGLKVGLDLGDMPFEGRVEKGKGLGAMPNVTHMVVVEDAAQIDAPLMDLFGVAFERTRKKKK